MGETQNQFPECLQGSTNFESLNFGLKCQYSVDFRRMRRHLRHLGENRHRDIVVPAIIITTENWVRFVVGRIFNDPNPGHGKQGLQVGSSKHGNHIRVIKEAIFGEKYLAPAFSGEPQDILGRMRVMSEHKLCEAWRTCMDVLRAHDIAPGSTNAEFGEVLTALFMRESFVPEATKRPDGESGHRPGRNRAAQFG